MPNNDADVDANDLGNSSNTAGDAPDRDFMTNAIAAARVAARLRFPLLYLYLSWTFQREVATAKLQPTRKKNSSGSGGSSMPTPATTATPSSGSQSRFDWNIFWKRVSPFFYENPHILPGVIVSAALLTAGLSSGGSTFLYSVTGFTVFDRASLDSSSDPAQEGSPLPTWTTVAIQKFEQTYWAHFAFTVLGVVLTCLWPVWPWSRTACAWILENVYGEEVQLIQAEDLPEPDPKKNEDEPTASAEGGATTTATERNLTGARNRKAPLATTSSGRMHNYHRMESIIDTLTGKCDALKESIHGLGVPDSQEGWKSLCKDVDGQLRDVHGAYSECYHLWQTLCDAQDSQYTIAPDLKELCYLYAAALDLVADSYFVLYDKAPIKRDDAMTFLNKAAEFQIHAIDQILRIFARPGKMPEDFEFEVVLFQYSDHYLQYVERRLEVAFSLPQDDQELSLSTIFARLKRLRSSLPISYWFLTDATVLTSRIGGLVSAAALLYRHYILAGTEWPLDTIPITRLSNSMTTWKKRREDEDEDTRKARCNTVVAVQDWIIELFDEVQKPGSGSTSPRPLPQGFPVDAVAETLWLAGIQLQHDGKNQEAQDKFQQARKLSKMLHTLMQTHIDTLQKEQTALDKFTQYNIIQINERQQERDTHIDTVQKRLSEIKLSASYCKKVWDIVLFVSDGPHSSLDSLCYQYAETLYCLADSCFLWFEKQPTSETTVEALHVLNDAALFQRQRLEALFTLLAGKWRSASPNTRRERHEIQDLLFKGANFYLKYLETRFKFRLRMEINQELSPKKIFGCLQYLRKRLPRSYWGFASTDRMSPATSGIGKLLTLATALYRHAIIIHPNEGKFEGPLDIDTVAITRVVNGRSERAYASAPDVATRGVVEDVQDIQDWILLLYNENRRELFITAPCEDPPSWIPLHAAADTFRLVGKRLQEAGKFDEAKPELKQALDLFKMLRAEQAAQFRGNHADTIRLLARSEGGLDFDAIPAFYHFDICDDLPWAEEHPRRRRYEKYSKEAYEEFSQLESHQIEAWSGEHADTMRIRALSMMMIGRPSPVPLLDVRILSRSSVELFDALNIEESRNEPEWRYEAANSLLIQATMGQGMGGMEIAEIVDSTVAACKRADYDSRHPGQMAFALHLRVEMGAAYDTPTRYPKEEEIKCVFEAIHQDAAKEWRPVFRAVLRRIYWRAMDDPERRTAPLRGQSRFMSWTSWTPTLNHLLQHHWGMEYLFTLACDGYLMCMDGNIKEATRLKNETENLLVAFELHREELDCQERSADDQWMSKLKEFLRYDPASLTSRPAGEY
ncbi:hypothetical protein CF327_g6553 [Tilletia walkeri]|nr:hypothetical protein CF327_g6553 [Tilletia walkeri]